MKQLYLWLADNIEHIARHGVAPPEAEQVVNGAADPYPIELDVNTYRVRGATAAGRLLHVLFSFKGLGNVDYEDLTLEQLEDLAKGVPLIYIYHARDMTPREKNQRRRKQR